MILVADPMILVAGPMILVADPMCFRADRYDFEAAVVLLLFFNFNFPEKIKDSYTVSIYLLGCYYLAAPALQKKIKEFCNVPCVCLVGLGSGLGWAWLGLVGLGWAAKGNFKKHITTAHQKKRTNE